MKIFNNWRVIILLCLTLGLAPFFPEPHIWEKLNWVLFNIERMQPIDYFDLLLHGLPFVLLIRLIWIELLRLKK